METSAKTYGVSGARQRILETAYDLFSRRGVRSVGVDELIEGASVAKATFYNHFPSKNHLALAFLEERERLWTKGWVEAESRRRGRTPQERLLVIFDLFDEWFHRDDFEGCSFVNVLLEFGSGSHPLARAASEHLENIRAIVTMFAKEAGIRDPASFALSWHILMKGSIILAGKGDRDAAKRAKEIARTLIEEEEVRKRRSA